MDTIGTFFDPTMLDIWLPTLRVGGRVVLILVVAWTLIWASNRLGVGLLLIIKSMSYEYANSVSRRKSSGMGGVGPTS
jgi:hypothetical protein